MGFGSQLLSLLQELLILCESHTKTECEFRRVSLTDFNSRPGGHRNCFWRAVQKHPQKGKNGLKMGSAAEIFGALSFLCVRCKENELCDVFPRRILHLGLILEGI